MRKRIIRKKNAVTTRRLLDECLPILSAEAQEAARTIEIYGCDVRRGRGYVVSRIVTVPTWTLDPAKTARGGAAGCVQYAAYYLAHELAHVVAAAGAHGPKFMAVFKRLCPTQWQHYELGYKPRNAAAAGITQQQ